MAFAAIWMDLEVIILSEVSQTKKGKFHDITYMWNLIKMIQKDLFEKEIHSEISKPLLWLS